MNRPARAIRGFPSVASAFFLFIAASQADAQTCSPVNAITGQNCVKLIKNYEYNPTEHWWGYFFHNSCGRALDVDALLRNGKHDRSRIDKASNGTPGVIEGDCTDNCGGVASFEVHCYDSDNPRPAVPTGTSSNAKSSGKCNAAACIAGCGAYRQTTRTSCEQVCSGAVTECYRGGSEPKTPEYSEDDQLNNESPKLGPQIGERERPQEAAPPQPPQQPQPAEELEACLAAVYADPGVISLHIGRNMNQDCRTGSYYAKWSSCTQITIPACIAAINSGVFRSRR
jgi:hypothetical protein